MRSESSRGSNGFGHVVVGAELEPGDAAVGFRPCGQHQDRHRRGLAQRLREVEAGLARHHHVEHEQVEGQAPELGARIARAVRRGDAIALAMQEAREQIADAAVVVDHEEVRGVVGECVGRPGHDRLSAAGARGRPGR